MQKGTTPLRYQEECSSALLASSLCQRQVIGIAGTDEKCRFVENLGATICLNYRSPSFEQDLIRETEGFVDIYFGQPVNPAPQSSNVLTSSKITLAAVSWILC